MGWMKERLIEPSFAVVVDTYCSSFNNDRMVWYSRIGLKYVRAQVSHDFKKEKEKVSHD